MTPLISLLLILNLLGGAPAGAAGVFGAAGAQAEEADRPAGAANALFIAGKAGTSELRIVEGLPVAVLEGTPEEIGAAYGKLTEKGIETLWQNYLEPVSAAAGGLAKLTADAAAMDAHIPERFRREMRALAKAASMDYGSILACNAFPDLYRKGGCSTFAASGEATESGRPLLARNLDFFGLGVLHRTSLLVVFRPKGQKPFLSVTWPGLSGVLSGMNANGLCCAVMEVREGKVTTGGMPSTFLFRRVMEEASGLEEALAILEGAKKVAHNNLMVIDRAGDAAVAEIGPGRFEVRRAKNGMVFSTNDHREGKEKPPMCRRFARCAAFAEENGVGIDIDSLKKLLIDVDQGIITVQSMIFEPAGLRIHLATGRVPASKAEYKTLDFTELLGKKEPESGSQK